jgi:hypothetical protein
LLGGVTLDFGKSLALKVLRRWMIDLEDIDRLRPRGLTAGKSVETRAEDQVLAEPAPNPLGEAILSVTAANQ